MQTTPEFTYETDEQEPQIGGQLDQSDNQKGTDVALLKNSFKYILAHRDILVEV